MLETQYSGDTILLIFPDGTGPALLSCLIGGIPLNRVHELEYGPGEVRLNINYESVNSIAGTGPLPEYIETIEHGKRVLSDLREHENEIMNVRDAQYAEELKAEKELEIRKKKAAEEREVRLAMEKEERARIAMEREELIKKEREERITQSKQKRMDEIENRAKSNVPEKSVDTTKARLTDTEATVMIGAATIGAVLASSLMQEDEPLAEEQNETNHMTPEGKVPNNQLTMKANSHANGTQSFDTYPTKTDLDDTSTVGANSQNTNITDPGIDSLDSANGEIENPNVSKTVAPLAMEAKDGDQIEGNPISVTGETLEKASPTLEDEASEYGNTNISPLSGWDPDEDDGGIAWLNALNEIANED